MNPVDDQILEFLEDNAGTPSYIADNIDYAADYVNDRCGKLVAYGLLTRPKRGLYMLTGDGRDYLAGELDADDLEAPE